MGVFDFCSPSQTGLGLEILRIVPLIHAAFQAGLRARVWTFHPLVFDDRSVDIVPLQGGWAPLLPPAGASHGAVWLPSTHKQGPYVCHWAVNAARARGFVALDGSAVDCRCAGSYPKLVDGIAKHLFSSTSFDHATEGDTTTTGLYPPDTLGPGDEAPTVLNLIGAHGSEKGLSDAAVACAVADRIGRTFPRRQFVLFLHARVCANQTAAVSAPNVRLLLHLDSDSRPARLLHRDSVVISVDGGMAHAAIYRGCRLILIGLTHWLNDTAYLYEQTKIYRLRTMKELSEATLADAITSELSGIWP